MRRQRATGGGRVLCGLISLALAAGTIAAAQEPSEITDEQFVESLGDRYSVRPVDRQRLARLLFSLASTLDGGKSTVQFLRSRMQAQDLARDAIGGTVREMYELYAGEVGRFRGSATRLLDRPDSDQLLVRSLMDGHRSCWRLDRYTRLVETYGVGARDLMSVLSSTEACERFRTAAFQPRVESLVLQALASGGERSEQIRALQEELEALQQLVDDLRRIDQQQ